MKERPSMNCPCLAKIFCVWAFQLSVPILADDFYVVTGTYKIQPEAQQAAVKGGWVLNTNFYNQLTPNLFAVVRGPFRTKDEADKNLKWLVKGGKYPESYVKNAGAINIEVKIGNRALTPQMLAALLGEIRINVKESAGASNPCEPQEPYKELSLSYVTIERGDGGRTNQPLFKPKEVELEVGAFWEIKSTGQIDRMRVCAE